MENKPNLVFVATRVPYPPVTGHYLRTLNILRGLSEHFAVHFFGFRDKNGTPAQHADADEALKHLCASIHVETVGAERSRARLLLDLAWSLITWRPFTAAKYYSRTMRRAIRGKLITLDVALVHADSLQSGQYLKDASQPKLLTNHNVEFRRLFSHAAQQRSGARRLAFRAQAWLTKGYERSILRAMVNCVVVSEADRAELTRLAPKVRFFVVGNGTDISLPPLPPNNSSQAIALWVGGMDDPFNCEGVLYFAHRILPLVRRKIAKFRWLVVGRDPPALLRALAQDPDSGVELAGFVPNVREAYERSTLVVVPLLSGGGTKLKVLEAMAMGRAVVTTPVGAEGLEVRDGVEMEIARDEEQFAGKVAALLQDPARRNRIAAAARAVAERRYAWDVVNRQMDCAVRTVIACDRHEGLAACAE